MPPAGLEGSPPPGCQARIVWEFVEASDLGPLSAQIRAGEGHAMRPAIDPSTLMALWLYATVEGAGST